jgi:hypothetical protein
VQGFDRFAYVNNNPLRYTDPTGHSACEEIPDLCSSDLLQEITGELTPPELIHLYANDPERMALGINIYMHENPGYNPMEDPLFLDNNGLLNSDFQTFNNIRSSYWLGRAGGDHDLAIRLRSYYDHGHRGPGVEQLNFDWSRMSSEGKAGLTLDVIIFGSSFVGLNPITKAFSETGKKVIGYSKNASDLVSTISSFASDDKNSKALTVASFTPGPVGVVATGAEVLYDLKEAFYFTPPIPIR